MQVEIVQTVGGGTERRYVLEGDGAYGIGDGPSESAGAEDQPGSLRFSVELSQNRCLLRRAARIRTVLNGRPANRDMLLVHGDRIAAGDTAYAVRVLDPDPRPVRVDDTFWVIGSVEHGWQLAQPVGIMRRHSDTFVENLCLRQDSLSGHPDIDSYAAAQFAALRGIVQALGVETLAHPTPFQCDAGLHARLTFQYSGKDVVQHHFFGCKSDDVCIAVWACPPGEHSAEEEVEAFRSLLMRSHFS